jgi:hypothetical protein
MPMPCPQMAPPPMPMPCPQMAPQMPQCPPGCVPAYGRF